MTRTVTVMVHGEPLAVQLDDDQYGEYARQDVLDSYMRDEWHRKLAEINGAAPPVSSGRGGMRVVGYGCIGMLVGVAMLVGLVLGQVFWH